MATRLALLAALALALILPSSALADDFWVQTGGTGTTPCKTQATPCPSLATAATAAFAGGGDIHVIGSYSDTTGAVLGPDVHLLGSGSGPGGTFLDMTGALALNMVGNATADAVRVRSDITTVSLQSGGALTNSVVETTGNTTAVSTSPGGAPADITLRGDTITAPKSGVGTAVGLLAPMGIGVVIEDSTLTGATGVGTGFGGVPGESLVVRRSTIDASTAGLAITGVPAFVSSSVIHMTGTGSTGVKLAATTIGSSSAQLIEDTIDGADTSGSSVGVDAGAGSFISPLGTTAAVTDSIVRGFGTDLVARASTSPFPPPPPGAGQLTVLRSDVGTQTAEPANPPGGGSAGPGVITDGGGNLNVDPGFVNRAAGNYALGAGSSLIDAAGTNAIDTGNNESATDRAGNARILDGDGNGSAARDMGAFEFLFTPGSSTTTTTSTAVPNTPPRPQIVSDPKFSQFSLKLPGGGTLLLYPPNLLKLPFSCGGGSPAPCVVSVVVQTSGPVVTSSSAKKKRKVLTLGRGGGTIRVGKSGTIKVKLSKAALKLFKAGKLRKIVVVAHVGTAASAKQVKKTYKLKAAPKKKSRKH